MSFQDPNTIDELFINQTLKNIEIYNVNDNYFDFEKERIIAIDGCVEMTFENLVVSIGWSSEKEFIDSIEGNAKTLLGDLDYYKVENETTRVFKKQTGKKITSVDLQLETISLLNDEFEPSGETEYIIKGAILEFEDNSMIQIALIDFEIDVDNRKLLNPKFDCFGNIMISLNNIIQIKNK